MINQEKKLILVVAVAQNGTIGKDNTLPWRLYDDLQHFKKITSQNVILMGRNTFNSLPKLLPNRVHIVVTSKNDIQDIENELYVVRSIEEGITLFEQQFSEKLLFLIGGGQLYAEALKKNLVKKMYITEVKTTIVGDTFFEWDNAQWQGSKILEVQKNEKNDYNFEIKEYSNY